MNNCRTILVTGAGGLVGSYVMHVLAKRFPTSKIVGISRRTMPATGNQIWIQADLAEQQADAALASLRADVIVHAAASLPRTFDDQEASLANALIDANVLALARQWGASVVCFSSQSVYENTPLPWMESSKVAPGARYPLEKLHTEAQVKALDTPVAILRISSPYGAAVADRAGVLYRFAREAALGNVLTVSGSGARTQDFVHGLDIAHAVHCVLSYWEQGKELGGDPVLNIASGQPTSMLTLARLAVDCAGKGSIALSDANADESFHADLQISKVEALLNWSPTISLRQGLMQLIHRFEGRNENWFDL